jgi:two-component system, sensor histidine kinase PdtaS
MLISTMFTTARLLPLTMLLVIAWVGGYGQGMQPNNWQSAFQEGHDDTTSVRAIIEKGRSILNAGGEISKAMAYGKAADSLAQKIGFSQGEGESALLIAECFRQLDKFSKAVPLLKKAEAIFERSQSKGSLVKTYSLRGAMDENMDTRCSYYDKALVILKASGDQGGIVSILPDYSEVKMVQAKLQEAEDMLKESIRLGNELGHQQLQWHYGLLGAIQIQRRESVEALKNELLAIKIGERFGDTSYHMAEIYNYTAIVYMKMGNLDESARYLRKAISTGTHFQNRTLIVQFRSNLANILVRQNKLKEALENLIILEKEHGNDLPLNARIQMLSRFVRCYTQLHDLTNAARYAEQLIKYSDDMKPDEYDQLALYVELNRFLLTSHQYHRARKYVEQQRQAAQKFKLPDHRNQSYYYRFQIDSALGDMASALHYYQLYTKGKDSTFNETTAKQLNQLHVEFETEKKDKELQLKEKSIQLLVQQTALQKALADKNEHELAFNKQVLELKQKDLVNERQNVELLTKQTDLQNAVSEKQKQEIIIKQQDIVLLQKNNALQESDLQKIKVGRNLIIVGALVLAVICLLVYSRYRMKKRASETLALQREEIRQINLSLQALVLDKDKLLEEKEWLVKEVHHRVKNNLQMVISLLNSQSAFLSNQDAVAAIRESQRRMQAMSLIHERLYENAEPTIDMQSYIEDLVNYLTKSFDCRGIQFFLDLDPITLDVTKAVPVGLILNEAITNALKYAFPVKSDSHVVVSFKQYVTLVELVIADNGIGFSPDNLHSGKKSLGTSLIKGLTIQVGGTCAIQSDNGVEIIIRFSPAKITKSIVGDSLANTYGDKEKNSYR